MGYKIISAGLVLAGLFFIINSQTVLTGATVGPIAATDTTKVLAGLILLLFGIAVFMAEKEDTDTETEEETEEAKEEEKDTETTIKLTSSINKNKGLERSAEEAGENQDVQRDIDHLIKELSKGNLEAGLGKPGHIAETDVCYMRARRGGRLYYRKVEGGYDIVGKSSKGNQDRVIKKLKEIYKK